MFVAVTFKVFVVSWLLVTLKGLKDFKESDKRQGGTKPSR